jgi:hypothetical protein
MRFWFFKTMILTLILPRRNDGMSLLVDDAPKMDLIVTVCDNAAGETCPIWPGHPQLAHWGVADPAAIDGSHEKIVAAFQTTYEEMSSRIRALIASHPTAETIGDLARSIGQSEAEHNDPK